MENDGITFRRPYRAQLKEIGHSPGPTTSILVPLSQNLAGPIPLQLQFLPLTLPETGRHHMPSHVVQVEGSL